MATFTYEQFAYRFKNPTVDGNLDLLDDVLASRAQNQNLLSSQEFADYYARYSISTTRTSGAADVALPDNNVKAKFVEMYNLLNPATQIQINNDGTITGVSTEFQTTYTYDELNELNTTLRSHVYSTLTSEDRQDEEDATNPYSSRVQTFGSSRYLIFKLSDDGDSQDDVLVDDPDTEDEDEMGADNDLFKRRKNSNIQFKPFNEWKDVKEWNYEFKHGESVECLAVGSGWNAVFTNYNYIWVFSNNGLQKGVIS